MHTDFATTMQREYDDRFVRWQVNPDAVSRVSRNGDAVVIEQHLDHHGRPVPGPLLLCLGSAADLAPLLDQTLARIGELPYRVMIDDHASHLLPAHWRYDRRRVWDWMWTTTPPPAQPGEDAVAGLGGDAAGVAEIDALLDVANPESHGRPGDSDQVWLGCRNHGGRLVAAGVVASLPTKAGHLRGITTLPAARGRGLGTALSARLTRVALGRAIGVCSLGVYSDNAVAIGIYQRLGFHRAHTFCSGTLLR